MKTSYTTTEMKALILEITGYKTSVKKLTGSMKQYVRFSIKGGHKMTELQIEAIIKALDCRCYINYWSVDVKAGGVLTA